MTKKIIINSVCILALLLLGKIVMTASPEESAESENKKSKVKVLYITHEPGTWHKYTPQKKAFIKIAEEQGWDLSVLTGTHDEVLEKLASTPEFGKGFDVLVYNFCFAYSENLEAIDNLISQPRDHDIPVLMVHCSLHSFWPTFKPSKEPSPDFIHVPGTPEKSRAKKAIVEAWNKKHPNKEFPSWTIMSGIASTAHGPMEPIDIRKIDPDHPIAKAISEYTTTKTELYNNFIVPKDQDNTKPILSGKQGEASAIVLWLNKVNKTNVISFSLGHDISEWNDKSFQNILTSTVGYLASEPAPAAESNAKE